MDLRAILFDVNGTLIDIETDEGPEDIYRTLSHLLSYRGVYVPAWQIREQYYQLLQTHLQGRTDPHPEFDAVAVWRELLERWRLPPADGVVSLPRFLAETHRVLSRRRLQLYPHVPQVLDELRSRYRLAVVSDGQSVHGLAELRALGIADYFDPIIISGDHGVRKPDGRLFRRALDGLGVAPAQAVHVGNDMFRDVFGGRQAGLRTVFFSSNQGEKQPAGAEPDYIIYHFAELPQAVHFLASR